MRGIYLKAVVGCVTVAINKLRESAAGAQAGSPDARANYPTLLCFHENHL
jgi:hypothetical protein